MKQGIFSLQKGMFALMVCLIVATSNVLAVPAYPGWLKMSQPDGSTIEIRHVGDEFYHYSINREGKRVKQNEEGWWVEAGEVPSAEVAKARHAKGVARRQRKDIGVTPNLAPKGVVILANFKDDAMQSSHTQAVFDELCNSTNCTVNQYNGKNYGSAAQYFADQSNGSYRPQFDVYGPVTLSRNVAYYGTDKPGKDEGDDQHATDAVVEACILANQQYSSLNFANYDSNGDGYVDFVYVIYAGLGQADGGASTTIWPHNWEVESAIYYSYCTYSKSQCQIDGKKLNNYAMSGELSGSSLGGIGTLCHEFGHVMGLPDLYDTKYGTNSENGVTPGEWNIMDAGSYNGDGHCPPNYDPWEKYFFGWVTPVNLATEGKNITLQPNGTEGYQSYQINSSNKLQTATTVGLNYYIENRQKQNWDEFIPTSGMLVWRVDFNSSAWTNNEPNNTAGNPRYTIVPADGKTSDYGASGDTYPTGNVRSYTPISGHALTEITKSGSIITFKYNGGEVKTECSYELLGEHCTYPADGKVAINSALSLTITPDEGYTLDDASCWTVEMGTKNELAYGEGFTYNASTNEFRIAKVTDDVTILVEGKQQFQLTWMSNGVEYTKTTSAGTVVTPEAPEACEGKVFAGWCNQPEYQSESVAPAFVKTGDAVTEAKTFYAVFATEEAGSGASMEKASAIAVGDEVVLVYEADKKELSSISDSKTPYGEGTAYTEAPKGVYSLNVVAGSENGTYAFVRDNAYLAWSSGNSLKTATTLDENSSWNVSFEGGDAIIANAADETRILQWNANSPRFACYTSAQKAVQLYKKGASVQYSDYTTTCTKPEPVYYTIRFFDNGEQIGESQSVLKGEQAEAPADPKPACEAYTFAGWWTESLDAENTDAKEWITDFKATGDQDYYAVFSKTVSGEGLITEFVKANAITIGDEVALVYEANKMELSSISASKTPYGEGTAYTDAPKGVYSLSVVAGSEEGTYAFVRDKVYLAWTSGNSLDTINTLDANSSWNVSFDNGDAILTSAADETRKLQWNGSNPRFACYTSAQKAVQLYKKTSTGGSLTYYTTTEICSPTAVEQTNAKEPAAVKAIRNGRLVIIRGNEVFSVSGAKLN